MPMHKKKSPTRRSRSLKKRSRSLKKRSVKRSKRSPSKKRTYKKTRLSKKRSPRKSYARSTTAYRKKSQAVPSYLSPVSRRYVFSLSNCLNKFHLDKVRQLAGQFYVPLGSKREMCSNIAKKMNENEMTLSDVGGDDNDLLGNLFDEPVGRVEKKETELESEVDEESDDDV